MDTCGIFQPQSMWSWCVLDRVSMAFDESRE